MQNLLWLIFLMYELAVSIFESNLISGSCYPPMKISNGYYHPIKKEYDVYEKVTYSCGNNNYMFDDEKLICENNSTWLGTVPYCATPEKIIKVEHDANSHWIYDGKNQTCDESGIKKPWKIQIQNFQHPTHAIIVLTLTKEKIFTNRQVPKIHISVGKINCSDSNSEERIDKYIKRIFNCKSKSNQNVISIERCGYHWTEIYLCEVYIYRKPSFQCVKKTIRNGIVHYINNHKNKEVKYGDLVIFSCNKGFKLKGEKYLYCGQNKYYGTIPRCDPVYCTDPPYSIMNGKWLDWKQDKNFKVGDNLNLTCDNGYGINGEAITIQCKENGNWSKIGTTCTEKMMISLSVLIIAVSVGFTIIISMLIVLGCIILKKRKKRNSIQRRSEHIYCEPIYIVSDSARNLQTTLSTSFHKYSELVDEHYTIKENDNTESNIVLKDEKEEKVTPMKFASNVEIFSNYSSISSLNSEIVVDNELYGSD